jgi:hypothetical protein
VVDFPGGAALLDDDGLWVLPSAQPARSLGSALIVADRSGVAPARLHLAVDGEVAGVLARRASQFAGAPQVWAVDGTSLVPAVPAPFAAAPHLDPRVAPFADVLTAAGADPVVEHGRLIGEVEGLEVARVVVDDAGARLEVGVGRFDREGHALMSADQPTDATLRRVVDQVRAHRRADAEHHPLRQLAASRWLRSRLIAVPSLVGADHLAPMEPTVEAPDLKTPWPAPAVGNDIDGRPLVVVCSVGVDLDLVPSAADARLADDRGARLVLAVPTRDAHPVTRTLAAALSKPAEIVTVD